MEFPISIKVTAIKMSSQLIPVPQSMVLMDGTFTLPLHLVVNLPPSKNDQHILLPVGQLLGSIEKCLGKRPSLSRLARHGHITCSSGEEGESYALTISPQGIRIEGAGPAGLYYGIQTLRQWIQLHGRQLPCVKIHDEPSFKRRGFYHDVTRGKVPKLETLFELVEKMAHYKLNELQLYVEHTFAFAKHADAWEGADPLSAEDILRLDEHCQKHHIDLVPSLSTFGHFYTMLRSYRKQHLNELEMHATEHDFGWFDRMAHYTLNPQLEESINLVKDIVTEYAPLFRSPYFNICCDETFDLGKGHSKSLMESKGGGVYLDFLKKIMSIVHDQGKQSMFWGDIILHHPELITELPTKAIALDWDYSPEPQDKNSSEKFAQAGLDFYICPGVSAWNRWSSNTLTAASNIRKFAIAGKKHGAIGLLNTDWGDFGHINGLGQSLWGMIFGASQAWHCGEEGLAFNSSLEKLEFSNQKGLFDLMDRVSQASKITWRVLSYWTDRSWSVADWKRTKKTKAHDAFFEVAGEDILTAFHQLIQQREELLNFGQPEAPFAQQWLKELRIGLTGEILTHATVHLVQVCESRIHQDPAISYLETADAWRHFELDLSEAWHLRNRPSEYFRVKMALVEIARRIDKMANMVAEESSSSSSL